MSQWCHRLTTCIHFVHRITKILFFNLRMWNLTQLLVDYIRLHPNRYTCIWNKLWYKGQIWIGLSKIVEDFMYKIYGRIVRQCHHWLTSLHTTCGIPLMFYKISRNLHNFHVFIRILWNLHCVKFYSIYLNQLKNGPDFPLSLKAFWVDWILPLVPSATGHPKLYEDF